MSASDTHSTAALLAHDHGDLDAMLAGLDRAFDAGDVARSFECLDSLWGHLAVHIRAENTILFPALIKAAEDAQNGSRASSVTLDEMRDLVAGLRRDHDFFMFELTAAVGELRTLRAENRPERLEEIRRMLLPVRQRLETHNAIEESRAYQYAALLLTREEQAALYEKVQHDLKNLPPRLRKDRGEENP